MFDNLFEFNNKNVITGLTSELKAIFTYNYYKKNNKNILYVVSTLYEANQIFQAISNYLDNVLLFPMDDFLTSEALAISPDLKATRLETIEKLLTNQNYIVVTNLMGYLRYLPQKKLFLNSKVELVKNSEIDMKELIEKLYDIGYKKETIVTSTGEMAIRGYVIDIYPVNLENPIRIEFWGDTIESIRIFDSSTQRTLKEINNIIISSNTEFLCENQIDEDKNQKNLINYTKVTNIEEYLENPILIIDNYTQLITNYNLLQKEIKNYNETLDIDKNKKYMNELEIKNKKNVIYLENFNNVIDSVENTINYNSFEIEPFSNNITRIKEILKKYINNQKTVVICLKNRYEINKVLDNINLEEMIVTNEFEIYDNKINLIVKTIKDSFIFEKYVVINNKCLFNKKDEVVKYKSNFKFGTKIRDITKLNIGDYIVHSIHGIGKYMGLKTLLKNNIKKDYLLIEYRDNDKLYIPVEKIELISKYSTGDGIAPKINKLGSTEWVKTKLKVRKKLEDIAGELLKLYASREASEGFAFDKDDKEQIEFESNFNYRETKDQLKVIEEIKQDMESNKPMDRLLCGDVGYGKTEVAFRAIFKAVISGKQVAYLCPTTILANQHYENALTRFSNFPIRIELLNRFVSPKKVKVILADLKEGKVDVVIGTHRILSDDVEFKDLGLLVVDEEQRFGVKHKEKIKNMKNNIDILTLSATPIPRTLQMSMTGVRNLSLIETPPESRYPIQTYVLEENSVIIKDSIYKELSRDGQVFILYNYVNNLEQKASEIQKLIPEAKILIAHGRMNKRELEDIMYKFINHEADILICTTIIETGIDIPNVNTLIVLDADRFGLSQLYQLRGRVGRSNKIAYCYLMYDKHKILSEIAEKRLNAIKEFTELGSGYSIAMRDLSIRGAGDILGSEQAGFIDSVGIDLYLNMLQEEVNKLKGIEIEEEVCEIPLIDVETSINNNYIDDNDLKIEIHKKINTIDSYEKLLEVKEELEDRFGNIDEKMLIYMYEEWFEKLANKLNIKQIKQTANTIEIILPKELTEKINGETLFMYAVDISDKFTFKLRFNNLIITLKLNGLDKHFIYYLIELMEKIEESIK